MLVKWAHCIASGYVIVQTPTYSLINRMQLVGPCKISKFYALSSDFEWTYISFCEPEILPDPFTHLIKHFLRNEEREIVLCLALLNCTIFPSIVMVSYFSLYHYGLFFVMDWICFILHRSRFIYMYICHSYRKRISLPSGTTLSYYSDKIWIWHKL